MLLLFLWATPKQDVLNKTRPAAVMINVKAKYNAGRTAWFNSFQSWQGTGFILDKAKGIIATNKHVAGEDSVCVYDLLFSDGSHLDAKLLYEDPLYDIAFLKVDPKKLPKEVQSLKISKATIKTHDDVYAVTNTHGSQFSTLEGTISSLYENTGPFGDQSVEFSGITSFGASGSPVVDAKGELVGIIYGGRFTSGRFLPAKYLKYALYALQKDQFPKRQTAGIFLKYADLNDAQDKKLVSEKAIEDYKSKFKDCGNKIITISFMAQNSEARKKLKPGDIIWSVNGKLVGANLGMIDDAVNACKSIALGIYRDGEFLEQKLECTPIENDTNKMISFDNAIFSELSFSARMRLDVTDKKSVFLCNALDNSDFRTLLECPSSFIQIAKIDEFEITDLESLKKAIPHLVERKKLVIHFVDHGLRDPYENYKTVHNTTPQIHVVHYDRKFDDPKILEFDFKTHEWTSENIVIK